MQLFKIKLPHADCFFKNIYISFSNFIDFLHIFLFAFIDHHALPQHRTILLFSTAHTVYNNL